jgi:hypothetical protein
MSHVQVPHLLPARSYMFRDMGGRGQPLRKCYDPHPGLSRHFVRVFMPPYA